MLFRCFSCLFILASTFSSHAAPWVKPDDLALRNDIQYLADTGIITAPVTTYPLMWQAIITDVLNAPIDELSESLQSALINVKNAYQQDNTKNHSVDIDVYVATDSKRFTSFGNDNVDQANIELAYQYDNQFFAGELQTNYRAGINDEMGDLGKDLNLDGSYAAVRLGNWLVSAGAVSRWWGPSIDTNLIMSTNARPLPALMLSRNNSSAFETPWLSWIGPWTFTTQMAKLESERYVPDALLWSSRGTLRPFRGLELGASWSVQWAGEGQPSSASEFWKVITGGKECANGQPSCDPELDTYLGNQLAGFDARWSDTLFGTPYAIYVQQIGEDGSPNGLVTDKASLYGGEVRFSVFKHRLMFNLEYSDTQVACSGDSDNLNCYYEHGTYKSGYRYNRRTIGSTYDNDAEVISATLLGQLKNGHDWQVKLRLADLNTDNLDRYPDDNTMGNTVSKVAEQLNQLEGQYRFDAWQSRFTLGAVVSQTEIAQDNNSSFDVFLQWQYKIF
jgi:hypothetical protein